MNTNLVDEIKYLVDERVWKTKKIRMEAEARLNRNNLVSVIILNYYTFVVLAFSIWSLILDPTSQITTRISLMLVIASVGLFGVTLFLSTVGFKEKAVQFKDSYVRLDNLENGIRNLLRNMEFLDKQRVIVELQQFEEKYNEIISLSDNHSRIDYQKLVIDRKLVGHEEIRISYFSKVVFNYLAIVTAFMLPILLIFISLKN